MWILVFVVLTACTGRSLSSSCPVEITPSAAVVRFGDPLSANCNSTSNQTEGMGWESTLDGTPLRNGVTFVPLNIVSAKYWNIKAECYINLLDHDQCSVHLPITVYKPPDSVSISQLNPVGPYKVGQMISVQCDIVNVAPINKILGWWISGSETHLMERFSTGDKTPVNKSTRFELEAQRHLNGTLISCEADLSAIDPHTPTYKSKSLEVIVLFPPTFNNAENETLEIPAGSELIFNCTATGNPFPTYSWHFLHPIQKTMAIKNESQPILTPGKKIPGVYKCTVSNTEGTTSKYFTVVEAKRGRTTFAALVGSFSFLGALLFVAGLIFVTPQGTVAFNQSSYQRGQPTSSRTV